jgi:putative membrane protein
MHPAIRTRRLRALAVALPSWLPAGATAHDGGVTAWSFDPWIVIPLLFAAVFYARGVAQLWRRARPGHGVRVSHVAAFMGGWLAAAAALVSPLEHYASLLGAHGAT